MATEYLLTYPSILYPLSFVLFPLLSSLCYLYSVIFPLLSILCYLFSVLCSLPSVLFPLLSVLCTLLSVICTLYSVLSSRPAFATDTKKTVHLNEKWTVIEIYRL